MEQSQSGPWRSSKEKRDFPDRAPEVKRILSDTGIFPSDELYDKKEQRPTTKGKKDITAATK